LAFLERPAALSIRSTRAISLGKEPCEIHFSDGSNFFEQAADFQCCKRVYALIVPLYPFEQSFATRFKVRLLRILIGNR
jgi:hypothetical protein